MRYYLPLFVVCGLLATPVLVSAQPPGRGGPPGAGGRGGSPLEMISELFDRADTDQDGQLTKTELQAAMQSQQGGRRQRPGGPPPNEAQADQWGNPQGPRGGEEHGPPPRPGQVLPDFVSESLNLTTKQTRQLAALQTEVDKRLAAILTDEQQQQLLNQRPPHEHGDGEHPHGGGDREVGRPQRPQ
ncbi:EF-hand domain-containing protein [Rubripirellula amarantea]|nr:EF-hand domain-containing protein [Rubripirellula amarantea]